MRGATLTRAHFIALADAIAGMDLGKESKEEVIKHICTVCYAYNNDFDEDRFKDYIKTRWKFTDNDHLKSIKVDRTPLHNIVL